MAGDHSCFGDDRCPCVTCLARRYGRALVHRVPQFKLLREGAHRPYRATSGAAGFDLYWSPKDAKEARQIELNLLDEDRTKEGVWVGPRGYSRYDFSTGVAFAIPPGMVGLVFSRSGHGFKYDVRLANCVGVIDSDYRGEVLVRLTADAGSMFVKPGDAIAQIVFVRHETELEEVSELSATVRGNQGFGSTGR